MKFAFVVYDELTLLDFSGIYDPITRLKSMELIKDFDYDVCSTKNKVRTFEGLEIVVDKVYNDLSEYDYVFVPGGNGIMKLFNDSDFLSWLKKVSEDSIITSVCGGSLLLGAAGFLTAKKATTHPTLMKYLARFAKETSDSRIVEDGNIITARGVTSAIDLGLYLCEKIGGKETREIIQTQMDYFAFTVE